MRNLIVTAIVLSGIVMTGCTTTNGPELSSIPSYEIHNEFLKRNLATYSYMSRQVARSNTEVNVDVPFIHTRTEGRRWPDSSGALPLLETMCAEENGRFVHEKGVEHDRQTQSELVRCMNNNQYIFIANLTHSYQLRSQTMLWDENFYTMFTDEVGNQIEALYRSWKR